jgi:hypothetical protein
MSTLRPIERRWARSMFETIFPGPPRGELPVGIGDLELDRFLDQTFAVIPFESAMGLRVTIWIVALSPLFVIGRLRTLDGLAADERERVLTTLLASRLYFVRQLVLALKAIGSLLYCGDRALRRQILGGAGAHEAPLAKLRVPARASDVTEGESDERSVA